MTINHPFPVAVLRGLCILALLLSATGCSKDTSDEWPGADAVKTVYADNAEHYAALALWLQHSGHAYVYPSRRGTGVYIAQSDAPGTMRMFARGQEEAALDEVLMSLGVGKAVVTDRSVSMGIAPVVDREISYARSLLWAESAPAAKACTTVSRSSASGVCAMPLAQSWWLILEW